MTPSDLALAEKLALRLNELEKEAVAKLPGALRFEQYNQSCGFIEALRQVRDTLIPEIIEELQKS